MSRPNLMQFVSPVDPRTVFLFIACAIAFFMGTRFEKVDTMRVEAEFAAYKLAQMELLAKTQQEVLNESVAAHAAIQEVQDNARARETELAAHSNRLSARLDAERMRRQALAAELSKARSAPSATDSEPAAPEPDLYGETGKALISLTEDADRVMGGLQDCQAYVKVLRQVCGQ